MKHALPGADLIEQGVRDLHESRETIESLLVAIGSPGLRRLGIDLPDSCLTIRNIGCMTCWQRMTLIPRIRVTMP